MELPVLFLFLFESERRVVFKFVPFVFIFIKLICGSIIMTFSQRIVMLGESGNTYQKIK